MGVKLTELLPREEINYDKLAGKVVVFDGHLVLYQFISSIRQPDGTLLMDSQGNVTSHLVGLFSRTTNLMEKGLKPCFVFDGKPPALKARVIEKRSSMKLEAGKKYEAAQKEEDEQAMRKFAARTSRLTAGMLAEAQKLIEGLGLPWVQAPSEGEAQAAAIAKDNRAFAVATQDADALLFGAPRLVRNLSVSERRKSTNALAFSVVKPELVILSNVLHELSLNQEQLIALAMLIGTDYNPGGIKGIGPKKALALVRKHKDFDALFREANWAFEHTWKEVFDTFRDIPVVTDYELEWKKVDRDKVMKLLVEEHDFSESRVEKTLQSLDEKGADAQKGLGSWIK